jgi:hypothetical protein
MDVIVPTLLRRFSSDEGYKLFDDALPTRTYLHASHFLKSITLSSRLHHGSPLVPSKLTIFHIFAFYLISSVLIVTTFITFIIRLDLGLTFHLSHS